MTSNFSLDEKILDFAYVSPFKEIAARKIKHDGSPSQAVARTCKALLATLTTQNEACAAITAAFADDSDN